MTLTQSNNRVNSAQAIYRNVWRCRRGTLVKLQFFLTTTVTHRSAYSQEVAFVLLDLVADVLVEEQLAEDEGAHGLHIQTLRLRQDLLIGSVDGSTLLLLLEVESSNVRGWKHNTRCILAVLFMFPLILLSVQCENLYRRASSINKLIINVQTLLTEVSLSH